MLKQQLIDLAPETLGKDFTLTQLHGDASNRIYHRIQTPGHSYILMERPSVGQESPSEEIGKGTSIQEYSFLNMHRFLSTTSIRIPKIFAISSDEGLILLEDLGDQTLEKNLKKNPKELRSLYQKAIQTLIHWQHISPPTNRKPCIAWERVFDQDIMEWEFDHFIEWGLIKGAKIDLPANEKKDLTSVFRDIASELADLPQIFCHRDFQSRNLMVLPMGEIAVLDFQDAMIGPYVYDMVALLRDSYISLSEEDLTFLQSDYVKNNEISDSKQWIYHFDLQTAQRKLKDGGRFHYINLFKGNPSFLPHVPSSYEYAYRALKRIPQGKFVLPILSKYLKEFAS